MSASLALNYAHPNYTAIAAPHPRLSRVQDCARRNAPRGYITAPLQTQTFPLRLAQLHSPIPWLAKKPRSSRPRRVRTCILPALDYTLIRKQTDCLPSRHRKPSSTSMPVAPAQSQQASPSLTRSFQRQALQAMMFRADICAAKSLRYSARQESARRHLGNCGRISLTMTVIEGIQDTSRRFGIARGPASGLDW